MRKVMTVIKMRGSAHSKDLRLYDVTADGLVVGDTLYEYRGIITGVAQRHHTDPQLNKPAAIILRLGTERFAHSSTRRLGIHLLRPA